MQTATMLILYILHSSIKQNRTEGLLQFYGRRLTCLNNVKITFIIQLNKYHK